MERAWNEVLKRETGVRIRLCAQNGQPYQYEQPYVHEKLPVLDLTDKDKAALSLYFQSEAQRVFDFIDVPLYHLFYFKGKDANGLFLFSHHLIMDGFSIRLLFEKISNYAKKIIENQMIEENLHDFSATVATEKSALQSERYVRDIDFWKHQFDDWNGLAVLTPDRRTKPA